VAESTWSWYEQPWADAWVEPDPNSAIFKDRFPTRYVWRPDVEKLARWLVDNFNVSCNSYHENPIAMGFAGDPVASTDPDGRVWYIENTSLNVWGPQGRFDPIDPTVGQQVFNVLFNDPNPPNIRFIIWQGTQYGAWNNWEGEWFGEGDPFRSHNDHIHVTYW